MFEEIDQDLDGGLKARQLQCGSDNGGEFTNADVARVMNKWSPRSTWKSHCKGTALLSTQLSETIMKVPLAGGV